MNLPDCEINSLSKFILIVNLNPFFNESGWNFLDVFRDIKGSKILSLHDSVVFRGFRWLTKLASVGSFLSHFPEKIMGFFGVKVGN